MFKRTGGKSTYPDPSAYAVVAQRYKLLIAILPYMVLASSGHLPSSAAGDRRLFAVVTLVIQLGRYNFDFINALVLQRAIREGIYSASSHRCLR